MRARRRGAEAGSRTLTVLSLPPPIPLPLSCPFLSGGHHYLLMKGYIQSLYQWVSQEGLQGLGKNGVWVWRIGQSRLPSRVRPCPSRKPRRLPNPPTLCVSISETLVEQMSEYDVRCGMLSVAGPASSPGRCWRADG